MEEIGAVGANWFMDKPVSELNALTILLIDFSWHLNFSHIKCTFHVEPRRKNEMNPAAIVWYSFRGLKLCLWNEKWTGKNNLCIWRKHNMMGDHLNSAVAHSTIQIVISRSACIIVFNNYNILRKCCFRIYISDIYYQHTSTKIET